MESTNFHGEAVEKKGKRVSRKEKQNHGRKRESVLVGNMGFIKIFRRSESFRKNQKKKKKKKNTPLQSKKRWRRASDHHIFRGERGAGPRKSSANSSQERRRQGFSRKGVIKVSDKGKS